jgi:2-dehydropantoate 2-reductase
VTAVLIDEALGVLNAARVQPARVGRLPPRLLPKALRLPDVLFRRLAAGMLRVDPEARSSMWDDLEAGRVTEVDGLNGAVVELADRVGAGAPLNRAMRDLVHAVERGASRVWTADALWSNLRRSL